MTTSTARPIFDPVDTSFNPREHSHKDDVESPSLTSGNALARFEFEPGRSKDGTKVLMVEWEEDETTRGVRADWEIGWEDKKTVLPAQQEQASTSGASGSGEENNEIHRLYFLLGPGIAIPTQVLLQKGAGVTWRTNPLPAIFAPELGATARQAGKKGVLHTIWGKKRLQVLQREIEAESKNNAEGIGLEMAVAEKEWIEQNFGLLARPGNLSVTTAPSMASVIGGSLNSPTSPRSPGGGRLMDKLKGLRLGTSEADLSKKSISSGGGSSSTEAGLPQGSHNPLSPEGSDVAVGSFGSFAALKGAAPPSTLAAKPPQPPPSQQQQQPQQRKFAAHQPPESFAAQQRQSPGMGSLNAFASGDVKQSQTPPPPQSRQQQQQSSSTHDDQEDDLFALPMSPRSPEMTKSPFSFGSQDTIRHLQGEQASS